MTDRVVLAWIHPGEVAGRFMRSVLDLLTSESPVVGWIDMTSGPRIAAARNDVVRRFLTATFNTTEAQQLGDWLLLVDADMVFDARLAERMVERANILWDTDDRRERGELPPLVGALCFAGGRGSEMFPTLFQIVDPATNDGNPVRRVRDYPRDAVVKIDATGAACLLVHRSVLEAIGERFGTRDHDGERVPVPLPWFAETIQGSRDMGEDVTFCLRASAVGADIYVDTAIKVGHVKTVVLDEDAYDAARERKRVVKPTEDIGPTYVVIPVRDELSMTRGLLSQLYAQGGYEGIVVCDNGSGRDTRDYLAKQVAKDRIRVIDCPGLNIHQMWNLGLGDCARHAGGRHQVAILNNALHLGERFLPALAEALRSDPDLWAVSPNYDGREIEGVEYVRSTFRHRGLAGFAFMLRGEANLHFDEGFSWWFGDDDMVMQIESQGRKVGITGGTTVEHIGGGSRTARHSDIVGQTREADAARFLERWGARCPDVQLAGVA